MCYRDYSFDMICWALENLITYISGVFTDRCIGITELMCVEKAFINIILKKYGNTFYKNILYLCIYFQFECIIIHA